MDLDTIDLNITTTSSSTLQTPLENGLIKLFTKYTSLQYINLSYCAYNMKQAEILINSIIIACIQRQKCGFKSLKTIVLEGFQEEYPILCIQFKEKLNNYNIIIDNLVFNGYNFII